VKEAHSLEDTAIVTPHLNKNNIDPPLLRYGKPWRLHRQHHLQGISWTAAIQTEQRRINCETTESRTGNRTSSSPASDRQTHLYTTELHDFVPTVASAQFHLTTMNMTDIAQH